MAAKTGYRLTLIGLLALSGGSLWTTLHAADTVAPANTPAETAADAPENDDAAWAELEAIDRALKVNNGKLVFIEPPDKPVPLMINNIHLDSASLKSGWARMDQCHNDLDPVPATQIVYNPENTRQLRIVSSRNIARAWVEGATVQLQDIRRPARICVSGQTRSVLPAKQPGRYIVRNGPFMRRFLDGYYPMHVHLNIDWPKGLLRLVGTQPSAQKGFTVRSSNHTVEMESWFEGRLYTRIELERLPPRTGDDPTP